MKMHENEVEIDEYLVRGLIEQQFPRWSALPLSKVASAGTDNALFRLGQRLVVRLPRIESAIGQVEKEQEWLPRLAPHLPCAIPAPVGQGEPGMDYPWKWSVYEWIDGETRSEPPDKHGAAADLAGFIRALQKIDAENGPGPERSNAYRGEPLRNRDKRTRKAISDLAEVFDERRMVSVWEEAMAARPWDSPGVWIHGDLQAQNLLFSDGSLAAVIDFGCSGVGDPACDVMTAWQYLDADVRQEFRAVLGVDDDTWSRGRGWALTVGLIAYPYYRVTNPVLARIAEMTIMETITDRAV